MILALVFLLQAVIPAAYMVAPLSLELTVQLCSEVSGSKTAKRIAVPLSCK
jgi:hypothetical protein